MPCAGPACLLPDVLGMRWDSGQQALSRSSWLGRQQVKMWSNACEGGTPQPDWRGRVCVVGGSLGLQGVRDGKSRLAGEGRGSVSWEQGQREVEETQG